MMKSEMVLLRDSFTSYESSSSDHDDTLKLLTPIDLIHSFKIYQPDSNLWGWSETFRKLHTNGLERSFKRCLSSIQPFKLLGKFIFFPISQLSESIEMKIDLYRNCRDLKYLEHLLSQTQLWKPLEFPQDVLKVSEYADISSEYLYTGDLSRPLNQDQVFKILKDLRVPKILIEKLIQGEDSTKIIEKIINEFEGGY